MSLFKYMLNKWATYLATLCCFLDIIFYCSKYICSPVYINAHMYVCVHTCRSG